VEIPTDDEGMFEAVDDEGTVVGHGIVADGMVDFAYTDGTQEARTFLPVDIFTMVWTTLGLNLGLTLRAAV